MSEIGGANRGENGLRPSSHSTVEYDISFGCNKNVLGGWGSSKVPQVALRPEQDGSTEIFRLGSGQALRAFARRSPRLRPQDGSSYNLFLPTNSKTAPKGRVFLLDTMSFIFRAYHATSRHRPISTT